MCSTVLWIIKKWNEIVARTSYSAISSKICVLHLWKYMEPFFRRLVVSMWHELVLSVFTAIVLPLPNADLEAIIYELKIGDLFILCDTKYASPLSTQKLMLIDLGRNNYRCWLQGNLLPGDFHSEVRGVLCLFFRMAFFSLLNETAKFGLFL